MTWICDMDDETDKWSSLEYLLLLKEKFPKFKVTLFTIPGDSSLPHLLHLKSYSWIELALHGWNHRDEDYQHSPREMQEWSYERTNQYINFIEEFYPGIFAQGLKAPGWQISDGTYDCLLHHKYWVMDREYNDDRRPKGLKYHSLDQSDVLHFHTWDCYGTVDNFIGTSLSKFNGVSPDDDFLFVSEVAK